MLNFGTVNQRDFQEMMVCSGFFLENALGDGSALWIFSEDSGIRIKLD